MTDLLVTLRAFLPETLMAVGVLLAVVNDLFTPEKRKADVAWFGALVALTALIVAAGRLAGCCACGGDVPLSSLFQIDALTNLARLGITAAVAVALIASTASRAVRDTHQAGEYFISMLGLGLGGLVFAAANNLLTVYLGLEIISLTSYVLAGYRHRDRATSEAGMKYVMFGALASGLTLFGMSLLYGFAGSLDLVTIGQSLATAPTVAIAAPLVLVSAGIAYKLALVPFHIYAPDVYEGAPAVSVAAFSVIPKIATFAVLIRLLGAWAPEQGVSALVHILGIIGVITVTVGSLTALAAKDAKRILAFSAVAHAGTMFLVLALWPDRSALGALAWYLIAYAIGNLGAFTALACFEDASGSVSLSALGGAWKRAPWLSALLAMLIVSLAGIPPFAGFFAKWLVLKALIVAGQQPGQTWLVWLAVIVLLNTVAAAVAYLRIVKALFIDAGTTVETVPRVPLVGVAVVAGCALASLAFTAALPLVDVLAGLLR